MNNIVGIDFSVNNPAACITNSNLDFFYWVCVKNDAKPTRKVLGLLEQKAGFDCRLIESKVKKGAKGEKPYHVQMKDKLKNQMDVVNALTEQIGDVLQKAGIDPIETIYSLEGYSYGSGGNSLIDIVQATGILKATIMTWMCGRDYNRFYIFSPGELKNTMGCKGNAGKEDVFKQFITDPRNEAVKESSFYNFVIENKNEIFRLPKTVEEPFMGMIDSYMAALKLHDYLKSPQL